MTTLESIILSYVANALWQLPLLFVAGWLATRVVRLLGVAAEHRVWVGVLLLQCLLPAASTLSWGSLHKLLDFSGGPANNNQPHVSVVMGSGIGFASPHLPSWLLAALVIGYVAVTMWFIARFAWRLRTIRLLRQNATEVALSAEHASYWSRCAGAFKVNGASLCTSSEIHGPITVGVKRKLILLPPEMLAALPATELRTAIAHEFAHMHRHDFLKNMVYELLCLPVCFHPVLSLTRGRLAETREMICDRLAASLADQHQYARSLLRLASLLISGTLSRTPHAIGIFDATAFERRVMRLTGKPAHSSVLLRFATVGVCVAFSVLVCASILAFGVHVDALAASQGQSPRTSGPVAVRANIMQTQIVHKVAPIYPEDAKKAKISGKVELEAVIGKSGDVENLKVISGPKELQQSALDAVRQWKYKPFLLNGTPVEVKTTINITYSLSHP